MNSEKDETKEIKSILTPWLQERMPHAENLAISKFEKPGMGLSSETYILQAAWEEKGKEKSSGMVLRSAPLEYKIFPEYEIGHQFRIMQILNNTDVEVPEMLWMENDSSIIGVPFFLMRMLEGEVPQDYPSYHGSGMFHEATPDERAKMWWGTLDSIVKVHTLDWEKLGFSFLGVPGNGYDPVERQLDYWERYYEWMKDDPGETHPILESSMKWLRENIYIPEHVTLCWGDARMGNTLFSVPGRDVVAVMDWEMAYIGDPESDLAWSMLLDWQHSAGAGLPRCDGTPGYEETVARYEELTGWKVKNLKYNEVIGAVRYGMILVAVLKKFSKQGIPIDDDMIYNNVCTQRLAELLDLPAPGPKRTETADINDVTASVQMHFTGSGGYDWYIISEKGKGSRHEGRIENPTCSITVSLEDWNAIQEGELNRLEAWSSGRLVTEGDLNVMTQLEDMISELSDLKP